RRVARGRPGAATWGDEPKAALIQEGQMGPQAARFFYRRPLVALPVCNGLLVALDGPAFGHLTAPAPVAQELPDVRRVVAHPKVHLNHGRDAP
ncbi:MAG TPA: hypothetical protein VGC99_21335, partial [Candidatus Tectomicrobia bacterium]